VCAEELGLCGLVAIWDVSSGSSAMILLREASEIDTDRTPGNSLSRFPTGPACGPCWDRSRVLQLKISCSYYFIFLFLSRKYAHALLQGHATLPLI
jgi:hypothetical protein